MRVAIVGFPFSGKTSLFTAISGVPRDHLKLAEENLAAVKVPEPRLDWLEQAYTPKKRTEATMDFVDLPGSAEGDEEKAGLTKHLPTLRLADVLLFCLRAFDSASVPPHMGSVDPQRDASLLRDEMLLADMVTLTGRKERLEKSASRPSKEQDAQKKELALVERCLTAAENGKPVRGVVQPGDEEKMLRSFGLLTLKPVVVALNVGESAIAKPPPLDAGAASAVIAVSAALEAELILMEPADRPAFMADYGISTLARDRLIRACFEALGMIHFLTAGPEEVRAWPIPRGFTAVEAAGRIHTDLAKGFIKAETIAYDDLRAAGSMRDAKAANKVRQEPKGYVVQDGDVILFKHSA
ncbi:Ribosome-binding ATPase YchF [Phycisphaerae bacterium RAS1]|nr:Ribosome-binding ATPase YchF [Phycisphaerae bacterium RAS1]